MIQEYFGNFYELFVIKKKMNFHFRRWGFLIRTASVAPVAKKAIVSNEKITAFRLLPDQS